MRLEVQVEKFAGCRVKPTPDEKVAGNLVGVDGERTRRRHIDDRKLAICRARCYGLKMSVKRSADE